MGQKKVDKAKPPSLATSFLKLYCNPEYFEEIQGDILELFKVREQASGQFLAKIKYTWDVLRFFRWSNIKRFKNRNSNNSNMVSHNFKVAWRVLQRQKAFALINIFSLTIGLSAVMLIYLYVQDELSFDNFHEKGDRIYRVVTDVFTPEGTVKASSAYKPLPLGPTLQKDYPEIVSFARFSMQKEMHIKVDAEIREEPIVFADPSLLTMFSFPLVSGNPDVALANPKSAVLSESMAMKLFNRPDPIGETVKILMRSEFKDFVVSGVAQDVPANSTIRFDILVAYSELTYYDHYKNYWRLNTDDTYVELADNASLAAVNQKIAKAWHTYIPEEAEKVAAGEEPDESYRLQPLTQVHLDPKVQGQIAASDPTYSYILAGVALVILLIACANFTTLSIARSAKRSKEIAVRKVIGAARKQLKGQFLGEALLLALLAMLLALGLSWLCLDVFNQLTQKEIQPGQLFAPFNLLIMLGITLLVGLISGAYPAWILSRIPVLDVFRRIVNLGGGNLFSRVLLCTQFALSFVLITGTLIMIDQLSFLRSKDLGFQKEGVIAISNELRREADKLEVLKNSYLKNPKVLNLAMASAAFTHGGMRSSFTYEGGEIGYSVYRIDTGYFNTLGIELLEGRTFDPKLASDSSVVIVNSAFMEAMGPGFKVGDKIPDFKNGGLHEPKVIGVTNDYQFQSLRNAQLPCMLTLKGFGGYGDLLVKVSSQGALETLRELEATWYELAPDTPFVASFLSDDMDAQYESDERWSKIITSAAILAISIAMFGLIGLVGISVASRIKEIGIRKVLGAKVKHIFLVIFHQFRALVIVSLLVAIPVSYYIMNIWLEGFAFHINMEVVTYLFSAFGLVMMVGLIVGAGIVKTTQGSPVNSLRQE